MPWYKKLHWQIIIGMTCGVIYGLLASFFGWIDFTTNWIKPWGVIFINLLKLVAVPMIIVSLINGVASLSDLTRLSRIGGRTIAIYLGTTVLAVIIGLLLVNIIRPGASLSPQLKEQLASSYKSQLAKSSEQASQQEKGGPLDVIVKIVPKNLVDAAGNNRNMLQMVFVALLVGVGLVQAGKEKTAVVRDFLEGINLIILRVVELIMIVAPVGVFAQLASVITELSGRDPSQALKILKALGFFVIVVILGQFIQMFGVYGTILRIFTSIKTGDFFRAIRPAQLIGFSTSSSAATLPVNMKCCEEGLGVPEEITSFTLPVGATINMDGTSLYQAIAVVFIAQILGMHLSLTDQLTVILTTTLASIGTAGVPGAGTVMLIIVLQSINVPVEGVALILGVERIIDMFRTVTNVTGDAMVTAVVANSEGLLPDETPASVDAGE